VPCEGSGAVRSQTDSRFSTRERCHIDLVCPAVDPETLSELIWPRYRQDCLGPLGKSAWDVAALLETMVPRPSSYAHYTGPPFEDISRYKLGIVRQGFPAEGSGPKSPGLGQDAKDLFERSLKLLEKAKIVDPANILDIEELWAETGSDGHPTGAGKSWIKSKAGLLLVTDLYGAINDHLEWVSDCELKTIEDLVEWNEAHPVRFENGSQAE